MKLGSLFDGSGGFPLAGSLCGIEPVWASEIEPYPIAVTRSRFPKMKHFGDISKINGAEVEPVDIITFGSPCQDLSVAGKRAGLKHEANGDEETTRSGLFMEAVRIIKEMREATNGEYPSFALWENVPGAFSSNKGEDFRIVLEELIKIVEPTAVMPEVPKGGWAYADSYFGDGWSLSYRVFDAQYWGVPQRRRRIHLVLDLRGERAKEILFEREGVRGYFATGGTPWQGVADHAEGSVGADDREGAVGSSIGFHLLQDPISSEKVFPCLCQGNSRQGQSSIGVAYACTRADDREGANIGTLTPWDSQGNQVHDGTGNNVFPCLRGCGGAGYQAGYVLAEAVGLDGYNATTTGEVSATLGVNCGTSTGRNGVITSAGFKELNSAKARSDAYEEEKAPCLAANKHDACIVEKYVLDDQGGQQISVRTDGKAPTLRAEMHGNIPCVMDAITLEPGIASREGGHIYEGVAGTLRANAGDNQLAVCVKTWDARGNGDGETVSTLTGDHENRITDYTSVICLQGNGIDRADTAGCNGRGWNDKTCYTLNTIDRPAVCYGVETFHCVAEEEKSPTLKARDWKDPHVLCYREPIAIDRAAFNQGQNAQYDPQFYEDGTVSTLVARGPSAVCYWDGSQTCGTLTANNAGGNQRMPDKENFNCVLENQEIRYIVRRLTPTECARLQGFPDTWGHIGTKEDLTDEEWTFWAGVRNTHADINGKVVKSYTKAQMLTWYNKLHTDSAEYKMWGNGIALPPALYCMQGIVEALKSE